MRNFAASCANCGIGLRIDNKYGYCNRTKECRRFKGLEKYLRGTNGKAKYRADLSEQERVELRRIGRKKYRGDTHEEVVYLIYSPALQLVKIGKTVNMKRRFMDLRNGCPDIQLLATYVSGGTLERVLHNRFYAQCVRGEWFNLGTTAKEQVDEFIADFR